MKYIRTKDGRIYEIIEETENSFELCSPFEKKMGCSCIMIKRVLGSNEKPTYRLANTIEELCDVFVYSKCVFMTLEEAKHDKEWTECDWQQDGFLIYGAIWTDKGLIYVAKINDKGELELL